MSAMIGPGTRVVVTDYAGAEHDRVAISEQKKGYDFEVVWICRESEWISAQEEGRLPRGMPWPAEDVRMRPSKISGE
jgi:hypothetical protein